MTLHASAERMQMKPRPRRILLWACGVILVGLCGVGWLGYRLLSVAAGWGPYSPDPMVLAVEERAQALVAKRATMDEVAAVFGSAPAHIYTRAEVRRYRDQARPGGHKFWDRMLKYSETYTFPLPSGDILIFFDDSGRAAGFHSNIQ